MRVFRHTYCAVEQHLDRISERLQRLGIVTGNVTASGSPTGVKNPDSTEVQVLHIGNTKPAGMPSDVPSLPEDFTPASLLSMVHALLEMESPSRG